MKKFVIEDQKRQKVFYGEIEKEDEFTYNIVCKGGSRIIIGKRNIVFVREVD